MLHYCKRNEPRLLDYSLQKIPETSGVDMQEDRVLVKRTWSVGSTCRGAVIKWTWRFPGTWCRWSCTPGRWPDHTVGLWSGVRQDGSLLGCWDILTWCCSWYLLRAKHKLWVDWMSTSGCSMAWAIMSGQYLTPVAYLEELGCLNRTGSTGKGEDFRTDCEAVRTIWDPSYMFGQKGHQWLT